MEPATIPATTIPDATPSPTKDFLSNIEDLSGPIFDKLNAAPPGDSPPAKSANDRLAEEAAKAKAKPAATPADKKADTTKPVESKPNEDEIPEAIRKSEKASAHWKAKDEKHKKELAEYQSKIAAFEKDLSDYKKRPAKDDYDKLVKERDEINAAFKRAAIEKHPEFLEKYEKPMQSIIALAKQAAGEHGSKIEKLLNLPDNEFRTEQLDKIMDELSPTKANMLGSLLADAAKLQLSKEAELKDSDAIIARMEAEQKKQAEAEAATMNEIFERTIKGATEGDDAVDAFKEKADDPKWNEGVRQRRDMARAIYDGNVSPEERANAALWGSVAPMLMEQAAAQAARIKELEAEVTGLKSSRPTITGEDNTERRGDDNLPSNASVIDRIVGIAANNGFAK